jgi:hypothetical protein
LLQDQAARYFVDAWNSASRDANAPRQFGTHIGIDSTDANWRVGQPSRLAIGMPKEAALQNPVQQGTARSRMQPHQENEPSANPEQLNTLSVFSQLQLAEAGLEPARGLPPTGF